MAQVYYFRNIMANFIMSYYHLNQNNLTIPRQAKSMIHYSGRSRIFLRGANSLFFATFLPKTAWKWKNLNHDGARIHGTHPLGSANALLAFMDSYAYWRITNEMTDHFEHFWQISQQSISQRSSFVKHRGIYP